MGAFEDLHRQRVTGSLAMFDRMIFKGHLTSLYRPGAIRMLLWAQGYPMKEFSRYAQVVTAKITANAKRVAADAGRPYLYLENFKTRRGESKEDIARAIAERDGVTEGVICVLSVVESCTSVPGPRRPPDRLVRGHPPGAKVRAPLPLPDGPGVRLHARAAAGVDPLREIQVYVNGRAWLARQLDRAGIGYRRWDNALLSVDELEPASRLCDRFAHRAWPGCSTPSPGA